jgi:hypothetical protein
MHFRFSTEVLSVLLSEMVDFGAGVPQASPPSVALPREKRSPVD